MTATFGLTECLIYHPTITAPCLTKELISQQTKYSNRPMLVELTGLTTSLTILKQVGWSFEDPVTDLASVVQLV